MSSSTLKLKLKIGYDQSLEKGCTLIAQLSQSQWCSGAHILRTYSPD